MKTKKPGPEYLSHRLSLCRTLKTSLSARKCQCASSAFDATRLLRKERRDSMTIGFLASYFFLLAVPTGHRPLAWLAPLAFSTRHQLILLYSDILR